MPNFEDWMDKTFGSIESVDGSYYGWSEWDYSADSMRRAYEAGQQSVVLDELARKGQILDEIMAHYKVDPDD